MTVQEYKNRWMFGHNDPAVVLAEKQGKMIEVTTNETPFGLFVVKIELDSRKIYKSAEGVEFWAEEVGIGKVPSYRVVGQAKGYPATEAFDEWFADIDSADRCARDLAEGKEI